MTTTTDFISAIPILASLDIQRSVDFYREKLGFKSLHVEQGVYGVMVRGNVSVHSWSCDERHIAENTSCRIRVQGIDALFAQCSQWGIVHPNATLQKKPWGAMEFAILDPDGNLVTFSQHD